MSIPAILPVAPPLMTTTSNKDIASDMIGLRILVLK